MELKEKPKCTWSNDETETDGFDRMFESSCGHNFTFNEAGPINNGFKFCPYCGKPIFTNDVHKPDNHEGA